jgi:hypothetical protein
MLEKSQNILEEFETEQPPANTSSTRSMMTVQDLRDVRLALQHMFRPFLFSLLRLFHSGTIISAHILIRWSTLFMHDATLRTRAVRTVYTTTLVTTVALPIFSPKLDATYLIHAFFSSFPDTDKVYSNLLLSLMIAT